MNGSEPAQNKGLAKIRQILGSLDSIEVEALSRFYLHGQETAKVVEDLGIKVGVFRDLRSRVREAYLEIGRTD